MKLSLPLKLGIFVVLLFGLVVAACLLWTPLRVRYYAAMLESDNPKERVAGVDSLLGMGKKGRKGLAEHYGCSELEVLFIEGYWSTPNKKLPGHGDSDLTPLHFAAQKGYIIAAFLLCDRGANVNARDSNDSTPIHWAASRGRMDITALLLGKGANVNARTGFRMTPLHYAAMGRRTEIMRLLIRRGADVDADNIIKQVPLHMAAKFGRKEAVEFLIKEGSYVTSRAVRDITPLHYAADGDHVETASVLLEYGANVNAMAKVKGPFKGSPAKIMRGTPLDHAHSEEMKNLLRKHGGKTSDELKTGRQTKK
ncbi:MAG: ankyrin repeat domain-containing protein [Planctomycetota bacterium]|jgi:hypothetical protein